MPVKDMSIFAMAAGILLQGCGNKPSESIPTTAPPVVQEPAEIQKSLQRLGVRKALNAA